jgi:hypothetical protein
MTFPGSISAFRHLSVDAEIVSLQYSIMVAVFLTQKCLTSGKYLEYQVILGLSPFFSFLCSVNKTKNECNVFQ